ncbi:LysR family transcriptional regulator [Sedimentitalea nanhaiensis]|uniref:DNA-binding transcriptional regulator, LysR family n=1 Tax=Sedimentitalea nanhaiensis TaxID=999627 RepID=A0A1I7DW81_9RHOB|nr:LysR family transcriptional regulator [Sedimentitalea nanhaiensis]SFU15903.1 DNA-binding transcriptional regulator, LysR family [Sedimentitalea nanhaiensis]
MTVKLEMLRTFCVVAERGTLSGAAKILRRTPSAISMVLAQLEEHIGAPLFETDRKSRLTPLGLLVLEESQRATDVFDTSVEAIRRHAVSLVGIVRIAAVPSATIALLPEVIKLFRSTHPNVRIEISDVDSAAVRRRIQRDEADIGILSAQPGDALEGEQILCDDLGIVCSEGGPVHMAHLENKGQSDWSLLRHEPLVANPLCRLVNDPSVQELLASSTLEARNTTAILSFVRRNLGASILPYDAVRDQPDRVEFFVPTNPVTRRELRKIKQNKDRMSAPVAVFWSLLERC